MSDEVSGVCIGYSIFDADEECYEYNENACFIAATCESADAFREACCANAEAARVDPVLWDDLLRDFGGSGSEYAMEAEAYARFLELAQQHKVAFEAEAYDGDESLMVVEIG